MILKQIYFKNSNTKQTRIASRGYLFIKNNNKSFYLSTRLISIKYTPMDQLDQRIRHHHHHQQQHQHQHQQKWNQIKTEQRPT